MQVTPRALLSIALISSIGTLFATTFVTTTVLSQPTEAQTPIVELKAKKKPLPKPTVKPTVKPTPKPGVLQPFFDTTEELELISVPRGQAVDVTPKPPMVNAFDQQVLDTCGAFGSSVGADKVRALLAKNPDVVAQISAAVDGNLNPIRGFAKQKPSATFQEDLVKVWTARNGFEHIFCGQIKGSSKIGGLHFAPRYYELQQKGIAGRLTGNQRQEEVKVGEVYTIGIEAKVNGGVVTDRKKGYSYVSNAQEILTDGTRAYKAFNINSGANNAVCLYTVKDDQAPEPFSAVFVKNDRGIITFYPDATPDRGERSCGENTPVESVAPQSDR
jgi:Bacterial EndoU nuclease